MASAQTIRLLARLAERDLDRASGLAADAAANLRSRTHDANLLEDYVGDLSTTLTNAPLCGEDFAAAIRFRGSGIMAHGAAATAVIDAERLEIAARDGLAGAVMRRDAISAVARVTEKEVKRERANAEEQKLSSPISPSDSMLSRYTNRPKR